MLAGITGQIRTSPAVQADDTGWREDGEHGSLWCACTPTLRSSDYHHSRAGEIVTDLSGPDVAGVLGSDVYAGDHSHQGLHHRRWVHSLRAIHHRKKNYPEDEGLWQWANAVKALSEDAVAWAETLAFPPTLCERMERFLPELCAFVAFPGVPAHTTLAERRVRPLVSARTISGGSRSPKGSDTRMGLASLCGTWIAQGLHPFRHCVAFLTQPHPLGHV